MGEGRGGRRAGRERRRPRRSLRAASSPALPLPASGLGQGSGLVWSRGAAGAGGGPGCPPRGAAVPAQRWGRCRRRGGSPLILRGYQGSTGGEPQPSSSPKQSLWLAEGPSVPTELGRTTAGPFPRPPPGSCFQRTPTTPRIASPSRLPGFSRTELPAPGSLKPSPTGVPASAITWLG